jgi:hypothetical protein
MTALGLSIEQECKRRHRVTKRRSRSRPLAHPVQGELGRVRIGQTEELRGSVVSGEGYAVLKLESFYRLAAISDMPWKPGRRFELGRPELESLISILGKGHELLKVLDEKQTRRQRKLWR